MGSFLTIFVDFSKENSPIFISGWYVCVQFGEDPQQIVSLNVVSLGDCVALVEAHTTWTAIALNHTLILKIIWFSLDLHLY